MSLKFTVSREKKLLESSEGAKEGEVFFLTVKKVNQELLNIFLSYEKLARHGTGKWDLMIMMEH